MDNVLMFIVIGFFLVVMLFSFCSPFFNVVSGRRREEKELQERLDLYGPIEILHVEAGTNGILCRVKPYGEKPFHVDLYNTQGVGLRPMKSNDIPKVGEKRNLVCKYVDWAYDRSDMFLFIGEKVLEESEI